MYKTFFMALRSHVKAADCGAKVPGAAWHSRERSPITSIRTSSYNRDSCTYALKSLTSSIYYSIQKLHLEKI